MINCKTFETFDPALVPSPCFVVDEVAVENNLRILQQSATGLWRQSAFGLKGIFDVQYGAVI